MKNIKRVLTILAISTMAVAIGILIASLFGLSIFTGLWLKILVTLGTVSFASAFAIGAVNIFRQKRILSLISLGLLVVSTILAIIIYWNGFSVSALFIKLTIMIGMATVLFLIIVSLNTKLGKRYQLLQWICFALIIVIDVALSLIVWGVDLLAISFFLEIIISISLIAFALICALAILGKRNPDGEVIGDGYIKVKKDEYDALVKKVKEYEEKERVAKEKKSTKSTPKTSKKKK